MSHLGLDSVLDGLETYLKPNQSNYSAIIRLTNLIYTEPEQFPYEDSLMHPFELYVMKFVYPEIITNFGCIPESLLSERLKEFRNGLINEQEDSINKLNELVFETLKPEHISYFFAIKSYEERLSPRLRELFRDLLRTKTQEAQKLFDETKYKLDSSCKIRKLIKTLSKLEEINLSEGPFNVINQFTNEDILKLRPQLDLLSLIYLTN